jgi:hypothetical protein
LTAKSGYFRLFLTKSTTESLVALEAGIGSLAKTVAENSIHSISKVAILDFMTCVF